MKAINTILVPKNNFKIFTVDKDGNETGKSIEQTNTWTYYGYRNFWLNTSYYQTGTYYGADGGTSETGVVHIIISESDEEIDKEFEKFDPSVNTWASSSRVSTRDGVNYDAFSVVNIKGREYLQLRHMRMWEFGELETEINSVAIATTASATASILAGKTLDEPFEITTEEQLLVRYDILIPIEYVATSDASASNNVFDTKTIDVNGTEHTVTFAKNYFHIGSLTSTSRQYFKRGSSIAMNHGGWSVNNTFHRDQPYQSDSGDNWREYSVSIQVDPYPMGQVNISSLLQGQSSTSGGSRNQNLCVYFDPPLQKAEDDRVFINFSVRQEVEEFEP